MQEGHEVRVFVAFEVAKDAFRRPCREMLLDAVVEVTRLQAEGVAAEIYAGLFIFWNGVALR